MPSAYITAVVIVAKMKAILPVTSKIIAVVAMKPPFDRLLVLGMIDIIGKFDITNMYSVKVVDSIG